MSDGSGRYMLAIDLGTGGPKVALVGQDGVIAGHDYEPTSLILTPDGGAEQDPDDWWRAITVASRRLVDRRLVPLDQVAGVAVTSQWSGTVAVDAAGKHLMNAVIWLDSRGARHIGQVIGGRLAVQGYHPLRLATFLRRAGGIPGHSGKDPTAHILFIKHERPEVYRAAAKFLEPADHLNQRMCGRVVSSYDCIAAHWVTDNRDVRAVRYDSRLIRLSGLDPERLPDLVPPATVVGELTASAAHDLGLLPGTPVVTATGDVHSAVIGSGAVADFAGHLYLGTSSWLSCHVPWKRTDLLNQQTTLPSALPGRYILANEQEAAGACLTYARDAIFLAEDELGLRHLGVDVAQVDIYAAFDKIARRAVPGAGGVIFTPWLNGERTPVDDRTVRAGWHHVSLSTSRAELLRSVYEGVAFNSRWLLEVAEKFARRRLPRLHLIGGGARSDFWCQIHADVLDREIHRMAEPTQANARGAGLLAFVALGLLQPEEIASKVPFDRVFQPAPDTRPVYDAMYREFRELYRQTRKIHARLDRLGGIDRPGP